MEEKDNMNRDDIFSKSVRAGRRTYFFDVRSTRADDYYMTITESKRHTKEDGSIFYQKHKIYLYKEDFESFLESFKEVKDFIIKEKGTEIISLEKTDDDSTEKGSEIKSEESVDSSNESDDSKDDSKDDDKEENKDLKFEDI
tara:strand:- start:264 stop:689 length:426 start_codon:yes stop_codon:yes gene_type:complete